MQLVQFYSNEISVGTLIVFGTANHYIQRYPHLSTEHELERVVPRGEMNTTAIGHHAEIKVLIPCSWIIFNSSFQNAPHIFYLAVVLRVIRAGERFVNTQQLAHIRECFRLEITALIAMNAVRHTKSVDPVPHKHLCRGCGTLVGHCKHLGPVSKTALNG